MKKLFNISVYIVFIFALLSSCQIEKRHFSKGYFIDVLRNNVFRNNQALLPKEKAIVVDSFEIVQANSAQIEFDDDCSFDSSVSFKTDSSTFTKAKNNKTRTVKNYCNLTSIKKLKTETPFYSSKKHVFSQNGINKYHPFAILSIGFLTLSISSFLIFGFCLWATSLFVLLFFVFLILSIGAMFIARKKMRFSPDTWAGKKIVNLILFIEVGFVLLILLGMLLILPIIL